MTAEMYIFVFAQVLCCIFQKSFGKPFDGHFQQQYASTVLELYHLNNDLNEYLIGIQQYYDEVILLYLQVIQLSVV